MTNRPVHPATRRAHVLVVDDAPETVRLLGSVLRGEGYKVSCAGTGAEALELVWSLRPDLVLLDVVLPDCDGFDVCCRFRESPEIRDLPVIFITGRTDPADIVRGFRAGAVDYVTKPFNGEELRARVRTQLGLRTARREQERLIRELRTALSEVKRLSGLLPICAGCKKIRNDEGYWQQVDAYLSEHASVEITHGLCHECAEKSYAELRNLLNRGRS